MIVGEVFSSYDKLRGEK